MRSPLRCLWETAPHVVIDVRAHELYIVSTLSIYNLCARRYMYAHRKFRPG